MSERQLKWISPGKTPTAMAPSWAKKNIHSLYMIDRQEAAVPPSHPDSGKVSWVLTARRIDADGFVHLGEFPTRKAAMAAANADAGLEGS